MFLGEKDIDTSNVLKNNLILKPKKIMKTSNKYLSIPLTYIMVYFHYHFDREFIDNVNTKRSNDIIINA